MNIRPLTRSNKDGIVYRRSERVEQQIQDLAALSDDDLITHAHNQDKDDPKYIQEESLVYWIREYHYRGDSQRAGELAELLLMRCTRHIQLKLRKLRPQELVEQAEQDAVSDLFQDIFDLDNNRSDFLQVRFWLTLDRKLINIFNRYKRDVQHTESLAAPFEDDESSDDDTFSRVEAGDTATGGITAEQRELVKDGLSIIENPYRTAFILRHYYDWPIGSNEDGVLTISSYFKKDPRTIRNWLKRAEQALSEWRNEESL